MKKKGFFLFFLLFLLLGSAQAFDVAGLQPLAPDGVFSTFSTDSLPKGKITAELSLERSREPDFYRVMLKGAYGLSDNLEFIAEVPYVLNFLDEVDGMEDIAIGFKHRFYDEGKFGPSLAYVVTASIPGGHDELTTKGRAGIGLILSKRIGPFQGSFNLMYARPGRGDLRDEISFATGLSFATTHNSEALAEFLARRGHYSHDYNQLEVRLGYRIRTTDRIYTTIGVGSDFKNRSPEYRLLLIVSYTNAKEKKKVRRIIEEEE